jgi:hypothetical protein
VCAETCSGKAITFDFGLITVVLGVGLRFLSCHAPRHWKWPGAAGVGKRQRLLDIGRE